GAAAGGRLPGNAPAGSLVRCPVACPLPIPTTAGRFGGQPFRLSQGNATDSRICLTPREKKVGVVPDLGAEPWWSVAAEVGRRLDEPEASATDCPSGAVRVNKKRWVRTREWGWTPTASSGG